MADISDSSKISQKAPLANLDKTDKEFALKLYKDSNIVASKTQIHSSSHNATWFEYRATITRKC